MGLFNYFQLNETTWVEQLAAIFDETNQSPFEFLQPVIWYDGTTLTPNDYRYSFNCPFDEKKAVNSKKGFILLYAVSIFITIYSGLLAFIIKNKFESIDFEELKEEKVISAHDMFVFAVIFIENLQYLSLGITPKDFSGIPLKLSSLWGGNFKHLINFTKNVYWQVMSGTIIFAWIWLITCLLTFFKDKSVLVYKFWNNTLNNTITEDIIPVIAEIGFIPVLSIIMDLYICDKSIGDGWTDSYNTQDCFTFCFSEKHGIYFIIVSITLLIYLPITMHLRPFWQDFQNALSIKTHPKYFLLFLYGLVFIKINAYNYKLTNLWLSVSLFLTFYAEVTYLISFFFLDNISYTLGILSVGWIIILLGALIMQKVKYTTYLYFEPSKNLSEIVKNIFYSHGTLTTRIQQYEDDENFIK